MGRFFELVMKYPLYIFGGVVALLLLFWYMGSGGSSAQQGSVILQTGPSDTAVAANAMVEAERIKAAAAGNIAQQQAATYDKYFSTNKEIAEIDSGRQTTLASIITGATTSQTQIQANTMTELATIQKDKELSMADKEAALAQANINAANNLAQLQANQAANELNAKTSLSGNWWVAMNPATMAALWGGGPSTVVNAHFDQGSLLAPSGASGNA